MKKSGVRSHLWMRLVSIALVSVLLGTGVSSIPASADDAEVTAGAEASVSEGNTDNEDNNNADPGAGDAASEGASDAEFQGEGNPDAGASTGASEATGEEPASSEATQAPADASSKASTSAASEASSDQQPGAAVISASTEGSTEGAEAASSASSEESAEAASSASSDDSAAEASSGASMEEGDVSANSSAATDSSESGEIIYDAEHLFAEDFKVHLGSRKVKEANVVYVGTTDVYFQKNIFNPNLPFADYTFTLGRVYAEVWRKGEAQGAYCKAITFYDDINNYRHGEIMGSLPIKDDTDYTTYIVFTVTVAPKEGQAKTELIRVTGDYLDEYTIDLLGTDWYGVEKAIDENYYVKSTLKTDRDNNVVLTLRNVPNNMMVKCEDRYFSLLDYSYDEEELFFKPGNAVFKFKQIRNKYNNQNYSFSIKNPNTGETIESKLTVDDVLPTLYLQGKPKDTQNESSDKLSWQWPPINDDRTEFTDLVPNGDNKLYIYDSTEFQLKANDDHLKEYGWEFNVDGVGTAIKKSENKIEDKSGWPSSNTALDLDPGVYDVKLTAHDFAENSNPETKYKLIYDPYAPQITGIVQSPNNSKTQAYREDVTISFAVEGGLFDSDDRVMNAVKDCIVLSDKPAEYEEPKLSVQTVDGKKVVTATFDADGKYDIAIEANGKDYGDRQLSITGGNQTFAFEVAKKTPKPIGDKFKVTKGTAKNSIYYPETVTAEIAYDRPNLSVKDFDLDKDPQGLPDSDPVMDVKTVGDTSVVTLSMEKDGRYRFKLTCNYGNNNDAKTIISDTYVVDTKDPDVSIAGPEDFSANNGVVEPVISFADENLDEDNQKGSASYTIKGANHGEMNISNFEETKIDNGYSIKFSDFDHTKEMDDLYVIEATAQDLAGHEVKKTKVFSVNRFGSVFVLGDSTKALNDKYYTNEPQNVVVTEINVDDLVQRKVSVARDEVISELSDKTDYSVSRQGSDTTWKTYTYDVSKNNFLKDGLYSVTVYTEDKATNVQDNKSRNAEIEFAVDVTAPSIVTADIEEKGVYDEEKHNFNVDVTDNMGLESLTVYKDGKTIQTYTGDQLQADGNIETITLEESKKPQTITLLAKDLAGNKESVVFKDVVVLSKGEPELEEEEEEAVADDNSNLPQVAGANTTNNSEDGNDATKDDGEGGVIVTDHKPFNVTLICIIVAGIACVAAAGGAGYLLNKKRNSK